MTNRESVDDFIGSPSRRDFMTGGAGLLLSAGLSPGNVLAQSFNVPSKNRRILHIIGHSHIDAAWLWPWKDSADLVLTTFRSALDRMNETPGLRYSHSSTIHYQWVQDADPGMFEEILRRIREGRWEVVGGWPVEPDCNIPSTESFVRHCLYGKRYCSQALNVDVEIGFNPDSFGHAAGLPTILKHAGYKYYVFMRPQEHEMTLPRLFWWEGPDGSRVLTYHIYGSYDSSVEHLKEATSKVFPAGSNHGAFFMGVGDHGGGVTKAQIQQILSMRSDPTLPELRWSTAGEYFAAVESSLSPTDIPVVKGELQHHARGCYSACGEQKFQNRRAEHRLVNSESIALVASIFASRKYSTNRFADSWFRVLFDQFHDVLAGTSLFSDYQDARDGIGYACQTAQEIKVLNLEAMSKRIDLRDVPEGAVFAYNTLPWNRKALLEYRYQPRPDKGMEQLYTHLKSKDGVSIALQARPADSMSNFFPRMTAWVDLPPCGYKVFTIEQGTPPASLPYPQFRRISKDMFGLQSLCADDGTELLAANMRLVVIEDKSDTWAHGVSAFRKELGTPQFISCQIVEDGPATRVTRQTLRWQNSQIIADIAEFPEIDALEIRFIIDWHEHEQILKLEVPTRLNSSKVFAKVPGAIIQRIPNGDEEPCQDWVAVEGAIGAQSYTVALINNSTYSYDCLDGLLRTILIRSAPYARHDPTPAVDGGIFEWEDQGRQERTIWLVRGKGGYIGLSLDRLAQELQTPAEYVLESRHEGTEPWEQSFLEIGPSNVEILALKYPEVGSGVIVRLQERAGRPTTAHMRCHMLGLDQDIPVSAWEIRTLRILPSSSAGARVKVESMLELP